MFSDGFPLVVYAVSAEEDRSEGMVDMERGAWCLGTKGQKNYFNTTGPQTSDKIDMKVILLANHQLIPTLNLVLHRSTR